MHPADLRYTKDQSDNTGTREAWSLNMNARYLMDTQLQFMASLGVQHATNSRDAGNSTATPCGFSASSARRNSIENSKRPGATGK